MAEQKYELWTIPSKNKLPKHYPWYSERLRQKYLSTKPSGALLSSNWVFVRDGGDDYRTGVPRETMSAQPYLTKKDGTRHPAMAPRQLPPLNHSRERSARVSKCLDKRTIAFSKKVPRKEAQMQYIDVLEEGLTGHPLAVFSHYEDAVAPQLFEEIVEALDPEVRQDSASDLSDSIENDSPEEDAVSDPEDSKLSATPPDLTQQEFDNKNNALNENAQPISSFRWYPSEEPFDDTNSSPGVQERGSGHTKIQSVTKDFCDWVRELGGDPNDAHINNIEESTIFSLFASGYETKPALSVPIHVVQLSDVPLELRNGAMVSPDLPSLLQYGIKNLTIRRGDTPSKHKGAISRNHWIRHQYGAWYLPVDLWKHKNSPNGLSDPQEDTMKTVSEAKLKSRELDSTLATMHGAMSFREYVDRKNRRRPDFLHCVDPLEKEEVNVNSAKSTRGASS